MKETFTLKFFDWILLGAAFIMLLTAVQRLVIPFAYLTTFLMHLAFGVGALVGILGFIVPKLNGERFARLFILATLVLPPVLLLSLYVTDLAIYGTNRTSLLANPILYVRLILGVVFLIMTTKFSKQTKPQRLADYGLFVMLLGVFFILFEIAYNIQPFFTSATMRTLWQIPVKVILSAAVIWFGYTMFTKQQLGKYLVLAIIACFIYGCF